MKKANKTVIRGRKERMGAALLKAAERSECQITKRSIKPKLRNSEVKTPKAREGLLPEVGSDHRAEPEGVDHLSIAGSGGVVGRRDIAVVA